MSDIRKQLGLEYLSREGSAISERDRTVSDEYLQDAILAFGPKVMLILAKSPQRITTVFDLVDKTGESVSLLAPVLTSLQNSGYVDIIKEDLKGDHTVRLTDRGLKVVSVK